MLDRIAELRSAGEAAIAAAASVDALEEARVAHLGRKAELPNLLRGVGALAPEERGAVGKAANQARQALEALLDGRREALESTALEARLGADAIDVTLPGSPVVAPGRLHLITAIRREIEDVFLGLGFRVAEGPEIDLVHYNFDALNHDAKHPARLETDTFYIQMASQDASHSDVGGPDAHPGTSSAVLRTHTSPMQVRAMEIQPPPLYIVVPGRTYRRDNDATHTPQFHQVEGLAVDTDITLSDLKGTLSAFARALFGEERGVRFRPHFFPFTEPSAELDISCHKCDGKGFLRDGSRCNLCKGEGWIEILGCGEIDPNVFGYVDGYDPERIQGFAFGMGIERIAFLKHGVSDLRLFYDNDLRFLGQFG